MFQEKAFELLSKYPLCDHCLGRQFAFWATAWKTTFEAHALKVALTMQANDLAKEKPEGVKRLQVLATNGFHKTAKETLKHLKKTLQTRQPRNASFAKANLSQIEDLLQKALDSP